MSIKKLTQAIKSNDKDAIKLFFSSLIEYTDSKKCEIYLKIVSGAGCDSPIINKKDGLYSFDSYGCVFKNWRDWDKYGQYGSCGSYGTTNRLKCVANSCISFNREHYRVALVDQETYNDLISEGYTVKKLKVGFR